MARRRQRVAFTFLAAAIAASWAWWASTHQAAPAQPPVAPQTQGAATTADNLAINALATLPIKGRAPMTGYNRAEFGAGWAMVGACDMREHILGRDLTNVKFRTDTDCTVLSGTLDDPYTGKTIHFVRGPGTSTAVQIDHVVALGDAWQKGAQQLAAAQREQLYNDPLELLAVDGPANEQKSDGDAATWLPPNKAYRCRYVARQIAVKVKYSLWVTQAEHDAMERILATCQTQALPSVTS